MKRLSALLLILALALSLAGCGLKTGGTGAVPSLTGGSPKTETETTAETTTETAAETTAAADAGSDDSRYNFYVTDLEGHIMRQNADGSNLTDLTGKTGESTTSDTEELAFYKGRLYFADSSHYLASCDADGGNVIHSQIYDRKSFQVSRDWVVCNSYNASGFNLLGFPVSAMSETLKDDDPSVIVYQDCRELVADSTASSPMSGVPEFMILDDWIYYYAEYEVANGLEADDVYRVRLDGTGKQQLSHGLDDLTSGLNKDNEAAQTGVDIVLGYTHVWTLEDGVIYILAMQADDPITFGLMKIEGDRMTFLPADGEPNTQENLESAEKMLDEHTPLPENDTSQMKGYITE